MGFGAFAAGFAEGFVDQTLADRDRRLAQEDQLVQLGLASSMRQHEERTKREQAHREMYSQATQLAQQLNLVGEEALIFSQLNLRGGNVDKVISDIQSGTIQPISSTQMVRPTTDSPEAIDQQMMESGMADPSMVGAPEAQPEQEQRGGFWSDFLATESGRDRRVQQGIDAQLEAVGIDTSAPSFTPPTPTSQLIMGGDTSNLIPLQDITDVETFERAIAIAQSTTNLDPRYAQGLQSLSTTIQGQDLRSRATNYVAGANTIRDLEIAYNTAVQAGEPEQVLAQIQNVRDAVRTSEFEAPESQRDWFVQMNSATMLGDQAKVDFLEQIRPSYTGFGESFAAVHEGAIRNVTQIMEDGRIRLIFTDNGEEAEQQTLRPLTDSERSELIQLTRLVGSDVLELQEQARFIVRVTETAAEISQLYDENPTVATTVAGVATRFVDVAREGSALLGLVGSVLGDSESVTQSELEAELVRQGALNQGETLDSVADRLTSGEVLTLAEARKSFDAKILIMSMNVGAAEGQSGRALTNSMYQRMLEFTTRARTGRDFDNIMSDYIGGLWREASRNESALMNRPEVITFRELNGFSPNLGPSIQDLFTTDDRARQAAEKFNLPVPSASRSGPTPTPEPAVQVQPEPTTQQTPPATQERNTRVVTITQSMADNNPALGALVGQDVLFEELSPGQWSVVGPQ